jgi:hypothetical protein
MAPEVTIDKDDVVVIHCGNTPKTVTVDWAHNYGTEIDPDWYIEGHDETGIVYWKQKVDGGYVITKWEDVR